MKRAVIILIILLWPLLLLQAQSDLLLSNSGMNASVYNPASNADNGMINAHMAVRQQWVGFPDAPQMQHLMIGTFFDTQPMGLKLNFLNQIAGNEITRQLGLAYAYKVTFSETASLNLGLSAGFYQRNIRYSNLVFQDINEPLTKPDQSVIRPDFSFGFEFYVLDLTIGLAANHITTPARKATVFKIPIHNHIYINYLLEISNEIKLGTGVSWHNQGPINQMMIDAHLYYSERFEAGIAWRSADAFILKAGLRVNEYIGFVYSYDIGVGTFSNYNSGTHEIVLQLRLNKKSQAFYSPRFFEH